MGWMRALTKVLTRSRGTPAAAFAMYCSRKVLVDTELGDYTPCPPGEASSESSAEDLRQTRRSCKSRPGCWHRSGRRDRRGRPDGPRAARADTRDRWLS